MVKPQNDEVLLMIKSHFAKILSKNNPKVLDDFEDKMKKLNTIQLLK